MRFAYANETHRNICKWSECEMNQQSLALCRIPERIAMQMRINDICKDLFDNTLKTKRSLK